MTFVDRNDVLDEGRETFRRHFCSKCRKQVAMKRYWCPRCECGKRRAIWGWDCPHGAPRCFTDWCGLYREEMVPV